MTEWPIHTVHELVELGVIERPMDGNHGSIHPKAADFVESGIPFIMASDLKDGRVDLENCAFISEKQARQLAKGFSRPGDVLLSHKATIGRTAIVQESDFPFIMLTPQITYYRIIDRKRLNNRFLKYYFNSRSFLDIFEAWAGGGSTRAYLGITAQRGLPIPMPSIEIQLSIAELVGPLDDKIELNRQMNETLEAMAQAIFRDWFVDFGPVRRKLAGVSDPVEIIGGLIPDPARASELAGLFPNSFEDDPAPAGWHSEPLSRHINIIGGGTPKTDVDAYWSGNIPWFSVTDTPAGKDVFVFQTDKYISDRGLLESSARLVPAGTTIISARGTVGNLAVAAQDMAFNQSCYALTSRRGDHPFFVYLVASHAVEQLSSMAHGSVFSTITRQTFDAMSFPTAPLPVLAAIEMLLSPLFERIRLAGAENRTLAKTRDYLLPRLMSGEVRVAEAQEIAAAAA